MRLAHVWNLGLKELRSLARDRGMLVFILYAFTFGIYSAGTAMPETLHNAAIAIVDEDGSPLAQRIVDAFQPPYFRAPDLIALTDMDRRLDVGKDTFALDIPPDFQRDVMAGRVPAIQLNVDATQVRQAFTGAGFIQRIIDDEVADFVGRRQAEPTPPVGLVLRARFNPELSEKWFGAVMELINNITMLAIVLTGAALIREREHGTIEHLLVMPVTPLEIMLGKVWSMALVVLLATALSLFAVVRGLLAVPVQGSVLLFLAAVALHLFATTSMGIFLGTVARSMPQFGLLLILVLLPLEILSGGMTPRESMPAAVADIMRLAPTTHFVSLAQAVLYRGAGLGTVWPQLAAIFVIGAVLFAASLLRFRKTIATMA